MSASDIFDILHFAGGTVFPSIGAITILLMSLIDPENFVYDKVLKIH